MNSALKQWVVKGDNHSVKAKREKSAGRFYLVVFWDNQGILLKEYAPKGVTTTKEIYFNTVLRLWEAVKKYPGKLSRGIILLQTGSLLDL